MARIAIIDLLFNWPPDGGARVDVKQIASRLSREHHVNLFVPDFQVLFPRGRIKGELPFQITRIPFTIYTFNFIHAPLRFKRAVDKFRPDHVFIADGWYLKPYIVNIMKAYHPILRFYAYECFCLKFQGTLFRNDAYCKRTIFDGMKECLSCTFQHESHYKRLSFFSQEMFGSLAFTPLYPLVLKRALQNSSRVLCYNEYTKELILPYQENVTLAPSGVDTELFSPGSGEISRIPRILITSRINDRTKGFHIFREALAILLREGIKFKVVIPLREGPPPLVQGVEIVKWRTQNALPDLYRSADICVVPSTGPEPFGIVALEGMACGKPVIASNIGGLPTIIKDNVTGFLVPPNDPEALAQKIILLIKEPQLRSKLGEAGRRRALEFEWERIMDKIYFPLFR